jgi:ABC-type branched-subunit amino acid transport system substrate-binding protein
MKRFVALVLAISLISKAASAPLIPIKDDPAPSVAMIVSHVAIILGGARACTEISSYRVDSLTQKVMSIVIGSAATKEQFAELIQIFDSNETEGREALTAGKTTCKAIETELSELERATQVAAAVPLQSDAPAGPPVVSALDSVSSSAVPGQTAVRGITDREIKVGMIGPLTGTNKAAGMETKAGISVAFAAANAQGGVNGRSLRLVVADDAYEPAKTLDAIKHLYDDEQVFAFIGCYGTAQAAVSLPYALERRALFFAPISGASILRRDPPDRYVFNYRASFAEETEAAVQYLIKIKRIKPEQIAVFAQQDLFGDTGYAGVEKAIRTVTGGPGRIVPRLNYQRNAIDVEDALAQLKKMPPGTIKAIVMVATFRAAVRFVEKTRDLYPGLIYTNTGHVGATDFANELSLLGPRYLTGHMVTQLVPAADGYSSIALEYRSDLAKYAPGEPPDAISLEAYLGAKIFIEGVRRAGPRPDTEKVVEALESIRDFDLGLGVKINFSKGDHQAIHKVWGTHLMDSGKYDPVDLQ